MRKVFLGLILVTCAVSGQPAHSEPASIATAASRSSATPIGTRDFPVVVDTQGHKDSAAEAEDKKLEKAQRDRVDHWTLTFAAISTLSTLVLMIVGIGGVVAAVRTLKAIERQASLMETQIADSRRSNEQNTTDVRASIAEATRAATAMETLAASTVINTDSIKQSLSINREIADRQKLISEIQSRAYLVVAFEGMVPQNLETGIRFEPRLRITNRGNTPAHSVRFNISADVMTFPLMEDFDFPPPPKIFGHSSVLGPGMHRIISGVVSVLHPEDEEAIVVGVGKRVVAWGIVLYKDAFDIERFCKFGVTFHCVGNNSWMSQDTTLHNDSN